MKKFLLLLFLLLPFPSLANNSLAEKLSGNILLQVESYGRAWYVYPENNKRYYLKDGDTAYDVMSSLGLGISNVDLEKIPSYEGELHNTALTNRLKGRILLQVEERGEAWYVHPETGVRYYMKDGDAAYDIMRSFSLGISNEDLALISMNDEQVVPDTAFLTVAHATLEDGEQIAGEYEDTILPLASMTKLMTAITLLDFGIDLDKKVTITQDIIDYPKYYVGDDPTSEVSINADDTLTVYDLWVAMLLASSNQAAAALADQTELPFSEFIDRMNQKASSLGLKKALFFDVAGLDAHNVATPYEMAIIANFAFADPLVSELSSLDSYSITVTDSEGITRSIPIPNRNITLMKYDPDGVKTGYLVEAERNVAIKKDARVVVVMHALSMKQRNDIIEQYLQ